MKFIYSFLWFLLLNPFSTFCQDSPYHQSYFSNLEKELEGNKEIKEMKFYQKKFLNGNIRVQEMLVKYVNDTIDRYWVAGEAFLFHRNGKIKVSQVFDINHKVPIDTGYTYNKDGNLNFISIFQNDGEFILYPQKLLLKNIWYGNYTDYKLIAFYETGIRKAELQYKFKDKRFQLDGNIVSYDPNGTYYQKDVFKNGKLISRTMAHPYIGYANPDTSIKRRIDSISISNCIDIIEKDSLRFYFRERDILVDKECADYFREVKMNPDAFVFNGPSNDYDEYGRIVVASNYSNNILNGPYKSFFRNGQIEESGEFINGQKSGEWNYWFDNKQLKKVILFNAGDYYLKDGYTSSGKKVIKNGEGKFIEYTLLPGKIITGEIRNGKQHGKWTVKDRNYYSDKSEEYFNNGIFVEGQKLPYRTSYNKKYTNSPISIVDNFTDLLNLNYFQKTFCVDYGMSEYYISKRYNSDYGYLPFFDYLYQNFDPPQINSGYILVGFTINLKGEIVKINTYSTINDKAVEDDLIKIFSSCDNWDAETLNNSPVETSEIFVFQFFSDGYKILNDSRNSSPVSLETLSIGARFRLGNDSLLSEVKSNLKLPEEFRSENFNLDACFEFHVDQMGNLADDNGSYITRLRVTENEKILYTALKQALLDTGDWEPAIYNKMPANHYFIAVLNLKNGQPKLRLISRNWVLD